MHYYPQNYEFLRATDESARPGFEPESQGTLENGKDRSCSAPPKFDSQSLFLYQVGNFPFITNRKMTTSRATSRRASCPSGWTSSTTTSTSSSKYTLPTSSPRTRKKSKPFPLPWTYPPIASGKKSKTTYHHPSSPLTRKNCCSS